MVIVHTHLQDNIKTHFTFTEKLELTYVLMYHKDS